MPLLARRIAPLLLLFASACAIHVQTPRTERAANDALVSQAEAFMASYATDLLQGRRDAIVARYDPRGATMMGMGQKEVMTRDQIHQRYHGPRWNPPVSFAWRDLSYEVVGPDAVVVTGLFDWGISAERKEQLSYTGLLLRRDGRLMIRLEDESFAPRRPAATP
ncbi:MAG TPA: hypothetical protein VEX86_17260 [Longimicrobium sp.]|nr:hypothetical protein [Longimicrobium sp.]